MHADYAQLQSDLATALMKRGEGDAAEAAFRRSLSAQPRNAAALVNLASLLRSAGRHDEALACLNQALLFEPGHADIHNNLGLLWLERGSFWKAEASLRASIALAPRAPRTWHNLAVLLVDMGRHEEAEQAWLHALRLEPGLSEARTALGRLRLALGRYAEAWPDVESRLDPERPDAVRLPALDTPAWRGEPIAGKRLLLVGEQGFGDCVQFIRFAALLKAGGAARVDVLCDAKLAPLLRTCEGVDVAAPELPGNSHDLHCAMLSVPLRIGTTLSNLPARLPYLRAPAERGAHWRSKLPEGLKVGIVWRGRPTHPNDAHRSIALTELAPLWTVPDVRFVSLQKGRDEDLALRPPPQQPLLALGHEVENFADLAALVQQLDLVICVDTAVAHVAGALGKRCWVLLPATSVDWRWLRDREDSPWYPGCMRLYRQRQAGDWAPVLAQVLRDLEALARAERARSAVDPRQSEDRMNEANLLLDDGRLDEAEALYRRAMALDPANADAVSNLGLLLLRRGKFAEGWQRCESRFDARRHVPTPLSPQVSPRWHGQPLAGRTLLLVGEQGYGDMVQFVRYAALLKARGARSIVVQCPERLVPLLATCADIDEAAALPRSAHHFHCPLLSVPLHLGTTLDTIPAQLPYLRALPERVARWRERLPAGRKVGLVWRGRPSHPEDAHRSMPLATLAPLWQVRGLQFVGLQKEAGEEEALQPPTGQPLLALGHEMNDFADLAALVQQMDLVICVDTAVAHVAGALGKPCWVLLSKAGADWRWLDDRDDSPWYPGCMRLYRQPARGDWASVLERVRGDLARWARHRALEHPGATAIDDADLAAAEARLRAAIAADAKRPSSWTNLGAVLARSMRPDEAESALRKAIALNPRYAAAHYNLGVVLASAGRAGEAEAAYRATIAFDPGRAPAHYNLAMLLQSQRRPAEAEVAFRAAIAAQPDFTAAHHNLAMLLQEAGRWEEAEVACLRASELAPADADARTNLAMLRLALGRFEEGWAGYESRFDPTRAEPPVHAEVPGLPRWRGEPLAGRTLVLVAEQGLGDAVQFIRYAPLLKARGLARLSVKCPESLVALLRTCEGVDDASSRFAGEADWQCPMLSAPLYMGTTLATIPARLPYLHALPERVAHWHARLPAARKVGLVWRGSAAHPNDARRSLALAGLAPLWDVQDVHFVSLQKGQGEAEALQPPPGQPLLALGHEMKDFADAAAIVSQLDLVICVDTAIAHVAGALGIPCWVMLPGAGLDWRWMQRRDDSPWYPDCMRLYRQSAAEGWPAVVGRVASDLANWARS
ncbi:tetratricopeptide repeat protein [Ramlibacter sp.]|uniref:tetratricopeptide repeat protein n=1 Tax=Ramlibacter sp. TaxID=1917967 RepID=UPI003D0B59A2